MYQATPDLQFERLEDGSVRMIWGDKECVIADNIWASIVCTVSVKGELNGRWYEAMDFHNK